MTTSSLSSKDASVGKNVLNFSSIFIFLAPEVLFAIYLIPTKFNFIAQKFNLPTYFNPISLLFVILAAVIIIRAFRKNPQFIYIPKHLIIFYAALCMVITCSIFYSSNQPYGITKTLEFITFNTLACFAPFFLLQSIVSWERFLKTILALGIILSGFIIVASPYAVNFYKSISSSPRFTTALGGNYLALQYMMGMAVLTAIYYFLFKENSRSKNLLLIAVAGLLAAVLIYSPGKNPILSIFITFFFMTFNSLKVGYKKLLINRKIFRIVISILGFGTFLMLSIGWMFIMRFEAMFRPGYYGQVERVLNTGIAWNLFLDHPITGTGVGSFPDYAAVIPGVDKMMYPHNLPLEMLSETGILGFLFLILLIGFAFAKLLKLTKKYRYTKYYHLPNIALSLLLFISLTSLTGGNMDNPLLFALIGIAFVIEPIIKHDSTISPQDNSLSS